MELWYRVVSGMEDENPYHFLTLKVFNDPHTHSTYKYIHTDISLMLRVFTIKSFSF